MAEQTNQLPALIKPEEKTIEGKDGKKHVFILSNLNAIDGRRVAAQYPMSVLPKIGDYEVNEKLFLLLMSHVEKVVEGRNIRLVTPALVVNHIEDFEMSAQLEAAMIMKNFSFFQDGRSLDFFDRAARMLLEKLSETLTRSSGPSSPPEKPASTN